VYSWEQNKAEDLYRVFAQHYPRNQTPKNQSDIRRCSHDVGYESVYIYTKSHETIDDTNTQSILKQTKISLFAIYELANIHSHHVNDTEKD
jgi:hypothetical protein